MTDPDARVRVTNTFDDLGRIATQKYLRGVDRAIHSQITSAWMQWQRQLGRMPAAQDVLEFAAEVEAQYGQFFIGP